MVTSVICSDTTVASAQQTTQHPTPPPPPPLGTSGSILPNRASLLPKNSLGALLLDFRASLRAPADNHYGHAVLEGAPRDSAADLENMLEQLTSGGGDAEAINQELETVGTAFVANRLPMAFWCDSDAKSQHPLC